MSNAERLRRGLPIRSPFAARSFDGNGGRPDHPQGGAPGQQKDKHDGEHDNGKGPGDRGKNRGGDKHDGWHGDASCVPTTVTVTTSTKTHHVPTQHTLTRTESSCAGPTKTAKDCKTKTTQAPPVTKTKHCDRGIAAVSDIPGVNHDYTQTNTEYGARCTPRVHRN
ncbi:hypothetical protein A1Q2_08352 [Trichosporon asahii var. asahii CBS 8904]|uniref:Uncharacterized protein n=2 Tax=Trichosporon asahii var. asahii TaxID=189963 RepID=K1V0H1_TRIAC|nr:hypothetical protein A1Q1_02381 [Trichosporon asahii var. asahii CBS 2479]EJT48654.1 hypothetical protein A1Q1_02381 [Trichosporon asahii var. asahii CBS 2479]EKC97429.1 hypothetical protein A1Q2_08352 [Trichosporon asahii var. asahii CBS 8904]